MTSKPFKELNPATGRVWRLQELHDALENQLAINSQLKAENKLTDEQLLTAHQYLKDIKQRWAIHLKEWNQAVIDVKAVGVKTGEVVKPVFSKAYTKLSLATGFDK